MTTCAEKYNPKTQALTAKHYGTDAHIAACGKVPYECILPEPHDTLHQCSCGTGFSVAA